MAGTLTISTLSDGTNSTSATNCISGSAKAWVNFNGQGTVAIRASYNVSSITDNGQGNYTVNFTNAMTDTNYCPVMSVSLNGGTDIAVISFRTQTTSGIQVITGDAWRNAAYNSGLFDSLVVAVAIFR